MHAKGSHSLSVLRMSQTQVPAHIRVWNSTPCPDWVVNQHRQHFHEFVIMSRLMTGKYCPYSIVCSVLMSVPVWLHCLSMLVSISYAITLQIYNIHSYVKMSLFRCAGDVIFDNSAPLLGQICNVRLKQFSETCNFLQHLSPLTPEHPYFFAQIHTLGGSWCQWLSHCFVMVVISVRVLYRWLSQCSMLVVVLSQWLSHCSVMMVVSVHVLSQWLSHCSVMVVVSVHVLSQWLSHSSVMVVVSVHVLSQWLSHCSVVVVVSVHVLSQWLSQHPFMVAVSVLYFSDIVSMFYPDRCLYIHVLSQWLSHILILVVLSDS